MKLFLGCTRTLVQSLIGLSIALLISSCAKLPPEPVEPTAETWTNPYPEGTYEHFKAENYPERSSAYFNHEVLARTDPSNSHIIISLSLQRAFLMNGDEVAIDYPVSTGTSSHPTPAGTYTILEKIKAKRSNLYGKVLDASGKVVNSDADSRTAKIPPGGKFLGASMPYWMRFTWTGIGHHVGNVPRYPASHACIRGQANILPIVFSKVKVGTKAEIVE
ncbi:L,D-transpeptidase family protein [Roseibacillus persicicus]|uniref:L,D-transpeptidase family protein n=1 Tax=Roseibacillus persicicus TaxID=454148 RepID=UPI00398B76EE